MPDSDGRKRPPAPPGETGADQSGGSGVLDQRLEATRPAVEFNPAEHGLAPLSLEALVVGLPVPADLYLPLYERETRSIKLDKVSSKGEIYQAKWRDNLLRAEQTKVYLKMADAEILPEYFEENATALLTDPGVPNRRKALIVQEMASVNLRLLFASDLSPKAVEESVGQATTVVDHLAGDPQVLGNLSLVLRTDYMVYTHSVNVCMLAMAFGRYLGEPEGRVRSLGLGGMLHDVGMSQLPPGLVGKAGAFTPAERQAMQQHPRLGYRLLMPVGKISYDVLMMILHHHENADGTGYPDRLPAARTPYLARVLRLVDAYDAMTSRRSYHDARPAREAAQELIESMPGVFGADLVPAFIRFLASPQFVGRQAEPEPRPDQAAGEDQEPTPE